MSLSTPLIRVGISSCLLGEKVRHDGNHKLNSDLIAILGKRFQWVAVCPEVEMGLGVPRETMGLVKINKDDIRLITQHSNMDHTSTFQTHAKNRMASLEKEKIHGFILKKGSPSCGLKEVPLFSPSGAQTGTGEGMFVSLLLNYFPLLPMEEAEQLTNPRQCDSFAAKVLAYYNHINL